MSNFSPNSYSPDVQSPQVKDFIDQDYAAGFSTVIETDTIAPGLNEKVIRLISAKKQEPAFLLEWRLG